MEPFTPVTSRAIALLMPNIDTDVITPMNRMMERGERPLHHYAFEAMRYVGGDGDASIPNPDFCLNQPGAEGAAIMVVGDNFGCGSSRETAPTVIAELGIRCLIGSSFGDIFFNNCFQQGVLAVVVPGSVVARLAGSVGVFTVDLDRQIITGSDGFRIEFECNALRRHSLLVGLDDIGLGLSHDAEITAFQQVDRLRRPWVYPGEDH